MSILAGLKLALTLDKLGRRFGVDMRVPRHRGILTPSLDPKDPLDQMVAGIEADLVAGSVAMQRSFAESKEAQYPGYRAELNRQRVLRGLPPL